MEHKNLYSLADLARLGVQPRPASGLPEGSTEHGFNGFGQRVFSHAKPETPQRPDYSRDLRVLVVGSQGLGDKLTEYGVSTDVARSFSQAAGMLKSGKYRAIIAVDGVVGDAVTWSAFAHDRGDCVLVVAPRCTRQCERLRIPYVASEQDVLASLDSARSGSGTMPQSSQPLGAQGLEMLAAMTTYRG